MLLRMHREYTEGESEYEAISDDYTGEASAETGADGDAKAEAFDAGSEDAAQALDITVNFEELKAQNPDIVGWVYIKGTKINYPVVQAKDNAYYLKHTFYGNYNGAGTIFMDCANDAGLSDKNTILYGHHMKNGSMFAALDNYSEWWFYREHPVIYYITPEKNYRVDVMAAYETTGTSDAYRIKFQTYDEFYAYVKERRKKSLIDTSWLPVNIMDNLMTFSTCNYDRRDGRMVVQGKLTAMN